MSLSHHLGRKAGSWSHCKGLEVSLHPSPRTVLSLHLFALPYLHPTQKQGKEGNENKGWQRKLFQGKRNETHRYSTLHCAWPRQMLNEPLFPPPSFIQPTASTFLWPGISKVSPKGPDSNSFHPVGHSSLSQPLSSTTVTRKQPQTVCE